MSSYLINVEADGTLKAEINKKISAKGDRLVKDAQKQITKLIESHQLPQGEVLRVSGRGSIAVSCFLSHELADFYQVIAAYHPTYGYSVVKSNSADYAIGDRLDFQDSEVTKLSFCQANPPEKSTYLVTMQGHDTLKVGFSSDNRGDGHQVVCDAAARLDELIAQKVIRGGELLKIDGRSSVYVNYLLAHKLAHLYETIAIHDPKLGNAKTDRYIVAIEHGSKYAVGETISVAIDAANNPKVVLCGPPNTGKTVLREGLKNALLELSRFDSDTYVISGCPDGDGSWFSETASKDEKLAGNLREAYKASFTNEYAVRISMAIAAVNNPLFVFDVGGKITDENWVIMSQATHAVILAKTEAEIKEWQDFCDNLNLTVVAVIYSELDAKEDNVVYRDRLLTGTVHHLQRGEAVASRPMIQELAKLLISLSPTKNNVVSSDKPES